MFRPSLTSVLSVAFLAYMANSLWTIAMLFVAPDCDPASAPAGTCLTSDLSRDPARRILLFSAVKTRPELDRDLTFLGHLDVRDPESETEATVKVPLPKKVRNNGTLHLAVFSAPLDAKEDPESRWLSMISSPEATYTMVPLTQHHVREAETFNLLGDKEMTPEEKARKEKEEEAKKKKGTLDDDRPVTHLRSSVTVSMMSDEVRMPTNEVPPELYHLMRKSPKDAGRYLPVVYVDELSLRLRDLRVVNATDEHGEVLFKYRPISYGKLRMFLQFTAALSSMRGLGFTAKDTDEVKGIFADTNLALLLVTFAVSAVHLLFDFLAFKNDVSFWRGKRTMEGLSTTTVLWRAFSQTVVFLYLLDENTSLLVLGPSGVAALIEMWKVTKALKVEVSWSGGIKVGGAGEKTDSEKSTDEFDANAMK